MTPSQRRMARHALGLNGHMQRSYRNRYVVWLGADREAEWDDLCRQGLAERGANGTATVGFCLTLEGARSVLHEIETLDPEDFPEAAGVAR